GITNLRGNTNPNLILILAAAAFAGLFTVIYRIVNDLTRRLFVPAVARRKVVMAEYVNAIGNLPEPAQLGQIFLRNVQSNLATDDVWFMAAEEGPKGQLGLRPLASLTDSPQETAHFGPASPFVAYLRQHPTPLAQFDVDTLTRFSQMSDAERMLLVSWQRMLYMPIHAGETLVGLLGLGEKYSGESYNAQDFEWLQAMAAQIGPLLAQAQNMASLRRINDFVFAQNQAMAREKRLLAELTSLQARFIEMVSPELRRPFTHIKQKLQTLEQSVGDNGRLPLVKELDEQIDALKAPLEHLIAMSGRIQRRSSFDFQPVHMDELARNAIRNLRTMAEARRVRVDFNTIPALPAVLGDENQLREAVQHLLHNAIKFNRIGGKVTVNCGVYGDHICVQVTDNGVGLPEERAATLWDEINQPQSRALGAGLGLPLTHFIASAHGGHVEVESVYGSGSTFSLHLPISFEV
ncbi:MAG: ATP-binding protein, partial [Anaerolineae bacterium]